MTELIFTKDELIDLEVETQATVRNLRRLQAIFQERIDIDLEETVGALNDALELALNESYYYYGNNEPSPLQEAVADYQRIELSAIRGGN